MTHDGPHEDPSSQKTQDKAEGDTSGTPGSRKERVLHTRVPAVLEQELRNLAASWRVPVSNVVRAILEDAVAAVDTVGKIAEQDLNRVVGRLAQQREKLRTIAHARDTQEQAQPEPSHAPAAPQGPEPFLGIVGYQPIILASDCLCAKCKRPLRRGEEALLGVRDGAGPRILIGRDCLSELNQPKPPTGESL